MLAAKCDLMLAVAPKSPDIRKLLSRAAASTVIALQAMQGGSRQLFREPPTSKPFRRTRCRVSFANCITEQCSKRKGSPICIYKYVPTT